MIIILILLAVILVFLIKAEFSVDIAKIKILKPIETLLVILIAAIGTFRNPGMPSILILSALVFSLAGDIALIDQSVKMRFTLGLAAFLLAHIIYIAAFMIISGGHWLDISVLITATVLIIIAIILFMLMRPNLNSMKIPVIIYMIIISLMVLRSFILYSAPAEQAEYAAYGIVFFIGAFLFYISDIILALSRFYKPMKYNRISLAFYYSGQTLIAIGTLNGISFLF